MKKTLMATIAVALLAAACGSSTSSSTDKAGTQLSASLDAKQVVEPGATKAWTPPASLDGATGTFKGTLDKTTSQLKWTISFGGLGDPISPIADVHFGKEGSFGAVLVRLCAPCKASTVSGTSHVKPKWTKSLTSGDAFVTVITEKYPNGAIRGQITSP